MMRFPAPLRPGDTIGVTSPSSGVQGAAAERIDFCIGWLRDAGYDVVVGECMDGAGITAGPAAARADELTRMLCDPSIRCVLPPWGGETAIDLLHLLDWDALAAAEPTWLVGYSDLSTILLPITTRLGWATLHGDNLADTPYEPLPGLVSWLDIASDVGPHRQRDSGVVAGWWGFAEDPRATQWKRVGTGSWSLVGEGPLHVSGRLIGGCVETLCNLAGTPYGDVPAFGRQHADDGLLIYLEAAGDEARRAESGRRARAWHVAEHGWAAAARATRRPPSAATCTACGWPAGSSTRTRSWSVAPAPRTTRS